VEGDAEQQATLKALNDDSEGGEKILGETTLHNIHANEWHTLKLQFKGTEIIGFVDGVQVLKAEDFLYHHGMAGLLADVEDGKASTPYFDNLKVNEIGKDITEPTPDIPNRTPIYE